MKNLKTYFINILIIIFSFAITLFIIELLLNYYYKNLKLNPDLSQLTQYSEIGQNNHHIRNLKIDLLKKGKQYYSVYKNEEFKNKNEIILLQGDSWVELLDRLDSVTNLMLTKSHYYINGGVGGYSPSLMEVQLNDIIEETELLPSTIITYIDHSDFMDEVCDYSKQRIEYKGKLIAVRKPSSFLFERYNHQLFELDIMYKKAMGLTKLQILIEETLKKYSMKKFISNSLHFCRWSSIEKFMNGEIDNKDILTFKNSLKSYLDTALTYTNNIILITHKHRGHYEKIYTNDINSTLHEIIKEIGYDKKIKIIDIAPDTINNLDDIFPSHEDDMSSHPHLPHYEDYIAKKIFELL